MGYASGTDVFDKMVDIALRYAPKKNTDLGAQTPTVIRQSIIIDCYDAMSDTDWDTQDESKYFQTDLVHLMYQRGEIDQDYYDDVVAFSE